MNLNALEVERALLALDPDEREAVMHQAAQSLEDAPIAQDQTEVDAAWRDELRSRIAEIRNGEVELPDGAEVFAQIRAELDALGTLR